MLEETVKTVNRLVVIEPLPPSGRTNYTVYPNCRKTFCPVVNSRGKLVSGLSEEDTKRLGESLGEDLSSSSPFWDTYSVILTDKPEYLDLSNPEDELKYLFLKQFPEVIEHASKKTAKAIFIARNQEKEAKEENRRFEYKLKAYAYLHKMSPSDRNDFLYLYGVNPYNMSDEITLNRLIQLAENDARIFVERFQDGNRKHKIFIDKLLRHGVLRKNGTAIYYGENILGADLELTVEYMKDLKNADFVIQLQKALETKFKDQI